MALTGVNWLLFGVGGVLMNETPTERIWASGAQFALNEVGVKVSQTAILRALTAAAVGGLTAPRRGALTLLTERAEEAMRLIAEQRVPSLDEPYPGTAEALEKLARNGSRLALIADPTTKEERARLEWSGLLQHFEVTLFTEELGVARPDPAVYLLALQVAGCSPQEAAVVGTRPVIDLAPARRLGINTVRVKRGIHSPYQARHPDEEADATVGSLDELESLLATLRESGPHG